jgi:hypothetical protein
LKEQLDGMRDLALVCGAQPSAGARGDLAQLSTAISISNMGRGLRQISVQDAKPAAQEYQRSPRNWPKEKASSLANRLNRLGGVCAGAGPGGRTVVAMNIFTHGGIAPGFRVMDVCLAGMVVDGQLPVHLIDRSTQPESRTVSAPARTDAACARHRDACVGRPPGAMRGSQPYYMVKAKVALKACA